jgi:hypothetical protein
VTPKGGYFFKDFNFWWRWLKPIFWHVLPWSLAQTKQVDAIVML